MGLCLSFSANSTWPPAAERAHVSSAKRGAPSGCFHKATSTGASCPCTLTRPLGAPRGWRPLAPCSSKDAETQQRPLRISILGGGPVGLSLALRLAEFPGGRPVSVTVIDYRWRKSSSGKFKRLMPELGDQMQEWRVSTLSDEIAKLFSASEATSSTYDGERVWMGSRNLAVQDLEERLLARVQEADVSDSIALAVGPPADILQQLGTNMARGGLLAFRTWVEGMDANLFVAADHAVSLTRGAFDAELGWAMVNASDGEESAQAEYIMGISLQLSEVSSRDQLLSMALSCAQTRYFYNSDSLSRRGCITVRLTQKEFVAASEAFSDPTTEGEQAKPIVLYNRKSLQAGKEHRDGLTRLFEQPWLEVTVLEGLKLFGFDAKQLASITVCPIWPSGQAEVFSTSVAGGLKVCCLTDHGAEEAVPCRGGRPSRGLEAGLEAADALARVLHREMPMNAFECFMQGLRCREMPSRLQALRSLRHVDSKSRERCAAGARAVAQLQPAPTASESTGVDAASELQHLLDAVKQWGAALQGSVDAGPMLSHEDISARIVEGMLPNQLIHDLVAHTIPAGGDIGSAAAARLAWLLRMREEPKAMPAVAFARALEAWEKLAMGVPEKALALLPRANPSGGHLVEETQDILALTVRAEAHLRLGKYEAAADDCAEALLLEPDNTLALMVQGQVNLRLGYLPDVIEDCDAVIEREAGNIAAYALRGEAKLKLGRFDEAVMDFDWALAHGWRSPTVLAGRGTAHCKLGNLRDAIADCDEALRDDPECLDALNVRGQAHLELGDLKGAVADFTQAVARPFGGKPSVVALSSRADALVGLRRYDEAIKDCDEALKIEQSSLALAVRAEANLLISRFAEAIADCDAALLLQPSDPYTYAVRAESFLCLGKALEAIRDCDQALDMCPSLEYAVTVRNRAWAKYKQVSPSERKAAIEAVA